MTGENPLFDDREIDFQLYDVHDVAGLTALPAFAEHSRETFDMVLAETRKVARGALFPRYREIDASPTFENGAIRLHPRMRELVGKVLGLGLVPATRGPEVGGQNLPIAVDCVAQMYLCAANLAPASFVILCRGPAHLIEAFGNDDLKRRFMEPLYRGEWTGTMALTEPQAGSSLGDITTTARPSGDHYLVRGTKIFISGGDHDLTDNIVHLVLARIEGAPPGTKGISLFAIPKMREPGVPNDVAVAGMVHKIGWKALPSLIMSFGEKDDCRGWLVGEPNQGLAYMFQMMNEARIGVGLAATATASAAYRQSLDYARTRLQGRKPIAAKAADQATGARGGPQVPILEHADVRRMLLRQKAICEGSTSLVIATARYADVAAHGRTQDRDRAQMLLDLLTPITKSFPAERGFESTALAVQIHGGYGYSSEYLPEAWLRDQKLNTIHEGTTAIQSMDLLGRKAMGKGGAALRALAEEISRAIELCPERDLSEAMASALATVTDASMKLGAMGLGGDAEGMMRHSVDYLDMVGTLVIGWQWLLQATAAKKRPELAEGKLRAARYFIRTEVPRIGHLASLCTSAESSYAEMLDAWF